MNAFVDTPVPHPSERTLWMAPYVNAFDSEICHPLREVKKLTLQEISFPIYTNWILQTDAPMNVDILIGADYYWQFVSNRPFPKCRHNIFEFFSDKFGPKRS